VTGVHIKVFHEIIANSEPFFISLEKLNVNVPSYLEGRDKGAAKRIFPKSAQNICQMLACLRVSACLCVKETENERRRRKYIKNSCFVCTYGSLAMKA
jgi:hypothetical protein